MDSENKNKRVEYPMGYDYFREGEVTYRHFIDAETNGNHIDALVSGEVEVIYFSKYKDHDPIIRRIILFAHNWQEDIRKLVEHWNSQFNNFKYSTNYYDL